MPDLPIRYILDPSGVNPDNLVTNEHHHLDIHLRRVIIPINGAFFENSLLIKDLANNRILSKDIDYNVDQLCREPTMMYGLSIYSVILIINTTVSSNVSINYQCLGGYYQQDYNNLLEAYINALNTNSPIDWVNVENKPETFNPTLHNHLTHDLYGFENLVYGLERLRQAQIIGNIPAFEQMYDYINSKLGIGLPIVTQTEIDLGISNSKYVSFERLLYAIKRLNFNAIFITPSSTVLAINTTLNVDVSVSNVEDDTIYYWVIEHINSNTHDFGNTVGIINLVQNKANFNISILNNDTGIGNKKFRLNIRKNSSDGFLLARSGILTITELSQFTNSSYGELFNAWNACCMFQPNVNRLSGLSWYIINNNDNDNE